MSRYLAAISLLALLSAGCSRQPLAPTDGDQLYHDEFVVGETGVWQIEGDELARALVEDGRLQIEIDEVQTIHFATLAEPKFEDFTLSVDVNFIEGDLENSAGVLFRMVSPQQFYRFDITGSGLYIVERHNDDGSWTRFTEQWTATSALKSGLQQINRLKIVADGPNFSFYANDQLLLQTSDDQYPGGQIALDGGTFGQAGLKVSFDNLDVKKP